MDSAVLSQAPRLSRLRSSGTTSHARPRGTIAAGTPSARSFRAALCARDNLSPRNIAELCGAILTNLRLREKKKKTPMGGRCGPLGRMVLHVGGAEPLNLGRYKMKKEVEFKSENCLSILEAEWQGRTFFQINGLAEPLELEDYSTRQEAWEAAKEIAARTGDRLADDMHSDTVTCKFTLTLSRARYREHDSRCGDCGESVECDVSLSGGVEWSGTALCYVREDNVSADWGVSVQEGLLGECPEILQEWHDGPWSDLYRTVENFCSEELENGRERRAEELGEAVRAAPDLGARCEALNKLWNYCSQRVGLDHPGDYVDEPRGVTALPGFSDLETDAARENWDRAGYDDENQIVRHRGEWCLVPREDKNTAEFIAAKAKRDSLCSNIVLLPGVPEMYGIVPDPSVAACWTRLAPLVGGDDSVRYVWRYVETEEQADAVERAWDALPDWAELDAEDLEGASLEDWGAL